MRIFLAKDVPSSEVWKEILWGLVISMAANLAGLVLTEVIHRSAHVSYSTAVGYASAVCAIIASGSFMGLRFPVFSSLGIAAGAGLVVFGSHQSEFWTAVSLWVFGLALIIRGFSSGPREH